jgi:hypothetical protein
MSREIITQDTIDVIDDVTLSLYRQNLLFEQREFRHHKLTTASGLNLIKRHLFLLNELIQDYEPYRFEETFVEENPSTSWLFYEEEEEVIPIYDEAIGVSVQKLIVKPSEISHLLAFKSIRIPRTRTGIDVDNHAGKGYHFHYGKIIRDKLQRYNVLMTFDKQNIDSNNQPALNIPLYIEPHASGKYKNIDASIIGHNRRLPIYLVCEKAMKSRGLEYFLSPSNNSSIFYPMT